MLVVRNMKYERQETDSIDYGASLEEEDIGKNISVRHLFYKVPINQNPLAVECARDEECKTILKDVNLRVR